MPMRGISNAFCVILHFAYYKVLLYAFNVNKLKIRDFRDMEPPLNVYSAYYSLACTVAEMILLLFSTASVYETSCKINNFLYKIFPNQYGQEVKVCSAFSLVSICIFVD